MTLEAERRFSKGLFFQVAYTAAKDTTETVEWFNAIESPFDLTARTRPRFGHAAAPSDDGGDLRPALRPRAARG